MTVKTLSETTVPGPTFTVRLPVLFDALAAFAPVGLARPAVPVLGGVRISSGPDGVQLAAFDYDVSVRVQLTDQPQPEQTVLVPFAELQRILKAAIKGEAKKDWQKMSALFASQITTGTEEYTEHGFGASVIVRMREFRREQVSLVVAGFELPLTALPVEDYPSLPEPPGAWFVAPVDELRDLSDRVAEASGNDPMLPMLQSQRWEVHGDTLTMACTNRFQLLAANVKVRGVRNADTLVDADTLGKVLKVLDGTVSVGLDPAATRVSLSAGRISVTMRSTGAEFPRFRRLFPDAVASGTTVVADRAQLVKLVAKAQAMILSRVVTVHLRVDTDMLVVTPDLGEQQDRVKGAQMPAQVHGEPLRAGFNPAYLAGLLGTFQTKTLALRFTSPTRPLVIAETPADLGDEAAVLRGLVMTVRLPE